MQENSFISILIPAYNEEKFISQTIDSIHHSFSQVDFHSYEIIVCDNNSNDATADIAHSKGVIVVFESHHQIAKARNTAAQIAKGNWLIFIDADTLLNAELLKETIQVFKSGQIGAGGAALKFDAEKLPWMIQLWLGLWNWISITFKLAAGSYLYCYREAWFDIGGFDERMYVAEELRFSRKLKSWCRNKGLQFKILGRTPIVTSSRKMKWYTPGQLFRQALWILKPRSASRRDYWKTWYTRPSESE